MNKFSVLIFSLLICGNVLADSEGSSATLPPRQEPLPPMTQEQLEQAIKYTKAQVRDAENARAISEAKEIAESKKPRCFDGYISALNRENNFVPKPDKNGKLQPCETNYIKQGDLGRKFYEENWNTDKGINPIVPQNFEKALFWLQQATESHNPESPLYLGFIYLNGYGVTQDYRKAVESFQLNNNIQGIYSLKPVSENIEADSRRMAILYVKQIAKINEDSLLIKQFNTYLFNLYLAGDELVKDIDAQSYGDSVNELALAEKEMNDTSPHYVLAANWYRAAYHDGAVSAAVRVGELFEQNKITQHSRDDTPDYDSALDWYKKAADAGNEEAASKLKSLQNKLAAGSDSQDTDVEKSKSSLSELGKDLKGLFH